MILGRNQEALVERTTIHKYGETSEPNLDTAAATGKDMDTISDHLAGIFHQKVRYGEEKNWSWKYFPPSNVAFCPHTLPTQLHFAL